MIIACGKLEGRIVPVEVLEFLDWVYIARLRWNTQDHKYKGYLVKHYIIPDYASYSITKSGAVWSNLTKRYLKQQTDKRGYKIVKLYGKNKTVHRLVAHTFIGRVDSLTVNHLNGIKGDNNLNNLDICTNQENMMHAYKTGLRINPFGEKANNVKLSSGEVAVIRTYLSIISNANLGLMFGVSKSTISKIRSEVNWRKA